MLLKKNTVMILATVLLAGIVAGNSIHKYYTHCMAIHYRRDNFYGKLAMELQKAMQKIGYSFTCPAIVPKTVIDFTYTGNRFYQNKTEKKAGDINIALVGDCYIAFDINFLKDYDYILTVDESRFGYIAMFNFKALHFPIKDRPFEKLCNTDYETKEIDIDDVAKQLDDIIRRVR